MLRNIAFALIAVLVVAGAAWAFWPRPLPVETTTIARQALDVTVEDEGLSQIKDVYTVSAPISGKMQRLGLEAGDFVTIGQTLATMKPTDPGLLDVRTRAVAQSNISAAQSAVDQATAQQAQAQAQLDFAQSELERAQSLSAGGIITQSGLQKAQLDVSVARTALDAAKANIAVRQRELDSAHASMIEGGLADCDSNKAGTTGGSVIVPSPVTGKVLSVSTTSEQVVPAGTPLLTIGDPHDLEITVNLLSRDAVAVKPGDAATIEGWGGPDLAAVVERVSPAAVTKVSALGIEEQRVAVTIRLADTTDADQAQLGHNFRVVVSIVVWHGDGLVAVPMGALFRQGGDWAVLIVADGKAKLRRLSLGEQNSDFAQVASGLSQGDIVILHPSDRVTDGTSVTVASAR